MYALSQLPIRTRVRALLDLVKFRWKVTRSKRGTKTPDDQFRHLLGETSPWNSAVKPATCDFVGNRD